MMLAQEVIAKKRDGGTLNAEEIGFFVGGITHGRWSDGQIAAMAMAVFLAGMDEAETIELTKAMRDSGEVLDWSYLDGPVVDKHSSGGIGDKVSLILAPVMASLGCFVPMLSGRGLGHTGGTLDKLEAIPGYSTQPDLGQLRTVVKEAGCAIVGQTGDLAPADRRLYAIRDVTATVESLPLIVASILSKKLAAGPQSLVMDVKCGNGAFMANLDDARALAQAITGVAGGSGLQSTALITDMNQCLGRTTGNALEVAEAVNALRGDGIDPRLEAVTTALCGELAGLNGLTLGDDPITTGRAAEHFAKMVHGLGGPADFIDRSDHYLPKAAHKSELLAGRAGFVTGIDTKSLGIAVIELGGGRRHPGDSIDHAVGLSGVAGLGTKIERGQPLLTIHAADQASIEQARLRLQASFEIGGEPPSGQPMIIERIGV